MDNSAAIYQWQSVVGDVLAVISTLTNPCIYLIFVRKHWLKFVGCKLETLSGGSPMGYVSKKPEPETATGGKGQAEDRGQITDAIYEG